MRQAFGRLPHCTWFQLVVELQRELNISRWLGRVDHARVGPLHRSVWRTEVHAVERIQEIATELQLEAFREVKVLMHADVPVVEAWSAQSAELRRARSESAGRVGVIAWIEPDESAPLSGCGVSSAVDSVGPVAIGSQTARAGSGRVRGAGVQRLGEAAVERHDRADLPATDHCVKR